jgi:tetratricopeptide (TPR) repeat protein
MKIKLILLLLAAAALSMGVSCKGKGPTKRERIEAFNEAGWVSMEEGNFAEALQEFADVVALDSDNIEGNIGLGWSLILMNSTNLPRISTALGKGTADTEWQPEAWAGLAVASLNQQRYAEADSLAGLVLNTDSAYVLIYYSDVDWRDLLVIQAQARYYNVDYAQAWQAVLPLLAESVTLTVGVPDGNLDPYDSATWVVNGTNFALYEAALADVIFRLVQVYGH